MHPWKFVKILKVTSPHEISMPKINFTETSLIVMRDYNLGVFVNVIYKSSKF